MTETAAPSLKSTLQSDLHTAMRERDLTRSATLRMALSAVTTEEVAGKQARVLTDEDVVKVLAKEAKKRKESATAYDHAGRGELAERERAELTVLETYLPAQLTDEELSGVVAQAIAASGAAGMSQLGLVMKATQPLVAGRADGGRVAAAVKRALQQS